MSRPGTAIRQALAEARTVDPHCHLRAEKPSADHLADIVLYHHVWTELVSSGMGRYETTKAGLPQEVRDPDMPSEERVRRCLRYLVNIESTTLGLFLRWILAELYDVSALTEDNVDRVSAAVAEKAVDPDWQDEVLRNRCGIDCSITVERSGTPYCEKMLTAVEYFPGNLVSGKHTTRDVLLGLDAALGREVRNADDYRETVRQQVRDRVGPGCVFAGCWVLPCITGDGVTPEEATRILGKARETHRLSDVALGRFCYFGACVLLEELRRTEIRTIQLIAGADVLPPHQSVTHWDGRFSGAVGRLASRFEDFHFNISSASDAYTQDLAILAKHLPNISVAGYWWHTFYPFYIRKSLETRLDIVPSNKIIGFFSDAYHSEWCYPKLKLVKHILGDILIERVERGWYTLAVALDIINKLLYENAVRIYRL